MLKLFWKSLLVSPAVLVTAFVVPSAAKAAETPELKKASTAANSVAQASPAGSSSTTTSNETDETEQLQQIQQYGSEGNGDSLNQVNSVSEFSDVSPDDWAYEALRYLVERYGCIEGYPDGTFRGNRALTRYEFAAGLNSCLQQIERLIADTAEEEEGGQQVAPEDLETLQRLVQEFQAELATLGTRVDNIEARTETLEENQFSTTTKLSGEVIFAVTDEFNVEDFDNNTVFQDRVRLVLETSFTGEDTLITRLAAGNAETFNGITQPGSFDGAGYEDTQTFNFGNTGDNNVIVDWLSYYFPFGDSSQVYLAAFGGLHYDYAPTLNPYFQDFDGGNGGITTFSQNSPIYRIGGGTGGGVTLGLGGVLGGLEDILGPTSLTLGYLAPQASAPGNDQGLANGDYSALGQLTFNISDRFAIAGTYVHGYHDGLNPIFGAGATGNPGDPGDPTVDPSFGSGLAGTFAANNPSALIDGGPVPTVTNTYGAEIAFRPVDEISLSGYASYTDAILIGRGGADIWSYGGGVAFSDLGPEGSVLGFYGGVQPTLKNLDAAGAPDDFENDNSISVEGFYKYQLTENISITPGVVYLTSGNQDEDNEDAIIGTLRTTFTF